ncbi:hypothetical protein BDP27DRAFT_1365261 [Rhodocollybia butyracea]|uniref:Uncharacterized protein n=1 Tax=Rhodocollybia butyracea TaxID=206335 RepID=A0A9P5PRZ5_9AGAR|nr:hypothetical protein BDP27DRAFT_1365261 [Rhodocollybia butyracea]
MSGGNKCPNSASVHSQKKPKTSSLQPSKNANGPGKPRQNLMTKNRLTFDGFVTSDSLHTLDNETQQDSNVTMEYSEGDKGDEGGNGDNGDEGDKGDKGDEGDDMVIEDVTKEKKKKNKQNGTRAKVLQSDLASNALAKISKQAVRKAICLLDMFPSDKMFAWEVLEEELVSQQGDDNRILEDLCEFKKDPQALDKLLCWVNSFCSSNASILNPLTTGWVIANPISVDEGGPQAELANWVMGEG